MAKRLGKRERAKKFAKLKAYEEYVRYGKPWEKDKLPDGNYASAGRRTLEMRAIGSPKIDWSFDGKHNKARKAKNLLDNALGV